jgi:hypothetical protein
MTSTANGKTILGADLTAPRVGVWHCDAHVDAEAMTGPVALLFEGVTYNGTVIRSGLSGGRLGVRIAGGAGGISRDIGAKNYAGSAGTKIAAIVADILREAAEKLSPTSDQTVLGRTLPKWERIAGPASHALVDVLDTAGAVWRVLPDGTIWIGMPTYPEATVDHVLIDEDWVYGILTIAPEKADLEPGVTFRGQKIEEVTHRLSPEALRTEAHLSSVSSSLNRFLKGIRRQVDYSRDYPGRVSKQNADGTLQIVPDDAKVKGSGLDNVPYYVGIPGAKVKVNAGQRVLLAFEAGDPSRPYVAGWQSGGQALEVAIGGAPLPSARQGDMIMLTIPGIPAAPPAGVGFLIAPPVGGIPPGPPPAGGIPLTFYGIITTGVPGFKT